MKRFLAILLIIAMLPIPATFAREAEPAVIPEEAFDAVTADVWEDIEAIEAERVVATRGRKATAADYAAIVDDVIAAVEASDTYVEGSINRNGAFFSWRTTEGVACGYSPSLRARLNANAIEGADPEELAAVETTSYAAKGGTTSSTNVAVFQPYYGLDSSFKVTYSNEGKDIAQALGGTSTTYITTAATVDAIADAFESCGVVIFDSHGDTDYYNPSNDNDFVSKANTSYLCLQSGDGLTTADMANVTGTYGTYQHAYYAGSSGSMKVYCVDGTAMANHMEKTAPHSLLWCAICLGMATDGLHAPVRAKGVEVAYGYSQSVSFTYDYKWEAEFWDKMIAGNDVATSIAEMKSKVGEWDYPSSYSTITIARNNYAAFPIVVSSEDTYPGKGNVDNRQTVYSTWKLKEGATPTEPTTAPTEPTTAPGSEEYSLTTSLKDGDQVIIYNAGAGMAMSEDAVSTNYRAGAAVTVSNNKIVTDDTKIVWTVKEVTGGYMFLNDDGETLSATKGLSFASTDNVWAVNAATTANSVYIVSTTATGTSGDPKSIEWYDRYSEFSTYYYSTANESIFAMQLFSKGGSVTPTEPTTAPTEPTTAPTTAPTEPTTAPSSDEYVLTTSLKDGDEVIIYNAGAGKAMSEDAISNNYRAGVDVTVSDNKIVTGDSRIVWEVSKTDNGYVFMNDDGSTLSATKGLSYADTDNVWAVNAATTANSVYIVSTTAVGTSGDPKYVEWYDRYSEFSTYYYSTASEGIFAMQLFVKGGSVTPTEPTTAPTEPTTAPTEPTTAPSGNEYVLTTSLKDGDEVVIYNASARKAMSEDAVSTNYRAGADVTVSGNKIVTDDSKIVWTVKASGNGYTFANDAGETLSATKGLSFAATDNVWAINAATTANSVYIVSTTATGTSGDPKYVEWYSNYSEFSTYYYSTANEAIFAMQLFVKSGSVTPTEPTSAPTEPTTAPTEPTTAPTEPTAAPTEPTTAPGTEGYYLADSVKTGDKIVLVASYNDKNYAMTNDTSISNALGAEEVTVIGDRVDVSTKRAAGSEVVWTLASGSAAGTYLLKSSDGKYISWTSSTSIKLSDSGVNFTITCGQDTSSVMVTSTLTEATNRGLFLRDNGGALQFRAYSTSNLTQSTYSGVLTIYKYTTGGTTPTEPTTAPTEPTAAPTEPTTAPTEPTTAPTEPTTAPTEPTTAPTEPTTAPSGNEYVLTTSLKDGDEVVIYNASAKKAMSEDAVSTNYRAGVDVTVSGNKIVTDDSKIVWTVKASGSGYTFANDAGETLSATKGLSFATTDNVWAINAATTANSVYLVSTTATGTSGDPKYVEWYDKYSEFSTYYYSTASEAIFAMQLFVRSGSVAPTEPTTAPTEPTTAPTEPTTAPTEPTTAPTEPIVGGSFVKVTAAPNDWSGKYLIVYESGDNGAIVYKGSDVQKDTVAAAISNDKINYQDGMAVVTVKKCGSGYSMQLEDGTYIDSRPLDDSGNEQNGIVLSETEAELTIEYSDTGVNVISVTGSRLRYNDSASEGRFRFYKSTTYANQKPIQLYKQTGTTPEPTEPTTEPTSAPTEPTTAPGGLPVADGDCVVLYNPATGVIIGYEEDTDYDQSTGNYTYCNVTTEAVSVSELTLKADYENAGTFYVYVNEDGTVYFIDQYDYDQSEDPENPDYYFLAASAPDTYYDSYTDYAAFEIIAVEGGYLLKNVADESYYAVENGVIVAKSLVEGDPSFIFQFAIWDGETEGENTIVCTLVDVTTPATEPTTAPTEPTTAPTEPISGGNEYVLTTSLKDGDEVVIYNAGAGMAMSEDAVSTNYRAGVAVTPSGNKIVTDDSKIVWTVKTSGSGYTFANDAGETLSATKGLSFATTDNMWAINAATTANSVYIVSTTATGTSGDPKSIEWYDKYTEFSTYYYSEASEAIFAMQLFVKSGSVTPTEPTTAPTEPTTAPTQPTTAPTEPTTAPTEPTTAPTQPTTAPTEPTTAPTQPTEPTTAPTEPTTAPTEPTTQYKVTVRADNEEYGRVTILDNVVIAIPDNGYYAAGFLLEPADAAIVEQNGNFFYLSNITKNCRLTIQFRAKDSAEIRFSVPAGCSAKRIATWIDEPTALKAPEGKIKGDKYKYEFLGWTEARVKDTKEKPVYYTNSYTPQKELTTLYALYTYELGGEIWYTTVLQMEKCPAEKFKDVDVKEWYHEALDFVLEYGYMNGVGDFEFAPNGKLTRAMMVTILYRLEEREGRFSHPFTDVKRNMWYTEAVSWAFTSGIVNGTTNTTFSPDEPITREQAATMLYRYAQWNGDDVTPKGSLMKFVDAEKVSAFARDPMRWAVGEGIINGKGKAPGKTSGTDKNEPTDILDPLGTATRAEIAQILYGWLN